MSLSLCIATCDRYPHLPASDQYLLPCFERAGITTQIASWSDDLVDWTAFDFVLLRSVWDYHEQYRAFLAWLDRLDALGVQLVNPSSLVRWNSHKSYLEEIAKAGHTIVPTKWHGAGEHHDLKDLLDDHPWQRAVIKPCVGASAYHTYLLPEQRLHAQQAIDGNCYPHGFMLQRFIPEIRSYGEWSMIFLGGVYSHAALKMASTDDFRVQSEFGGSLELCEAPKHAVQSAQQIMDFCGKTSAYARIDGVIQEHTFVLMEVELIEPDLFLVSEGLRTRYVDAVLASLS